MKKIIVLLGVVLVAISLVFALRLAVRLNKVNTADPADVHKTTQTTHTATITNKYVNSEFDTSTYLFVGVPSTDTIYQLEITFDNGYSCIKKVSKSVFEKYNVGKSIKFTKRNYSDYYVSEDGEIVVSIAA